ncbi:MAG: 4-hydroxy-tetrahydrodipicolinate synthase [Terricaulis silvestris]
MIHGSIPALITPFRNGTVDEQAFQAFVELQIAKGSHALVPCGTTGESATLSHEEHRRVVALCVEAAAGKVPVIAGAGSNSTEEAIGLARHAKEVGADAILSVAPYYNKPSQDGLYAHFKAINDAVDIPIIVYNIPGRSIVDISVETLGRLAKLKNIVGLKDAVGDVARVARQRRACGEDFTQLCGDDPIAVGYNAQGGKGCISVTANVAPEFCARMQEATLQGAFETAREIDYKLAPLHKALFVEPSPGPVKYACSLLGLCTEEVRLPILTLTDAAKAQVRAAMTDAGLL